MNANLERLIALQMQDVEAKRLREELAAAPQRVLAAEKALLAARHAVADAEAALKKEEVLRRGLEGDVGTHRAKITRLGKQMETAANAAQIAALEHEITFAQTAISKLEDDELASLERTDTQEAALLRGRAQNAAATANLAATKVSAAETVQFDTKALAAAEDARTTLRAEIDEGLLAQYDRVAKSRGTGVAEATGGQCTACRMMLRPQRWNDISGREHEDDIFTCESCGRMLYYDARRDRPSEWRPGMVTERGA